MSRWFSVLSRVGLAAAVVALCAPAPARASFAINFAPDAGSSLVVNDNGANDSTSAANAISYTGQVGSFAVQIASSLTNTPGSDLSSQLTLDFNSIRNTDLVNAHSLTITASATGYTQPVPPVDMFSALTAAFQLNNLPGDSVTIQSFFNPDNQLFSTSGTATPAWTYTRGQGRSGASTSDDTSGLTFSGAYSLTTVITLTLGANVEDSQGNLIRAAGASARLDINGEGVGAPPVVPAPAGVVLAASALPLLGLFGLRRRTGATPA